MSATNRMPNIQKEIALIGVPLQTGTHMRGCAMGPAALRCADLAETLSGLGFTVRDTGDVEVGNSGATPSEEVSRPVEMAAWTRAIDARGFEVLSSGALPIFMGGDHSMSMGSINAVARYARDQGRDLVVLWLDAHADFNTPESSPSGNMHGMPVAALCGESGLDFLFDGMDRVVMDGRDFNQIGIRSIDLTERELVRDRGVNVMDMRTVDEHGMSRLIARVLEEVEARDAMLHLSLDVDFLDPSIAPAVGTTVPGGATYRESHLIMEMLCDSGRVTSVDLAELNPFLDERGRSALLLVDLIGSLFGRKIIDQPHAT